LEDRQIQQITSGQQKISAPGRKYEKIITKSSQNQPKSSHA
jgi:hypothetical protein